MIDEHGTLKLCDFGLARIIDSRVASSSSPDAGSPSRGEGREEGGEEEGVREEGVREGGADGGQDGSMHYRELIASPDASRSSLEWSSISIGTSGLLSIQQSLLPTTARRSSTLAAAAQRTMLTSNVGTVQYAAPEVRRPYNPNAKLLRCYALPRPTEPKR